jgi:hypothetical protein
MSGRHHALGLYPAKLLPGSIVQQGLRRRRSSTSATAIRYEVTTSTGPLSKRPGLVCSGTLARRPAVES